MTPSDKAESEPPEPDLDDFLAEGMSLTDAIAAWHKAMSERFQRPSGAALH
jgi:hypothetical protein